MARMFTPPTSIKYRAGGASQCNQAGKKIGIQLGKEEVKLPLLADMVVNVKKN